MHQLRSRLAFLASRAFLVLSLALLALLYCELIMGQRPPGWGGDFDIFYAASSVFARHGNPYDMAQLYWREQAIFHPAGDWRHALAGEPYPQSPLLLVLLRPLLALSPAGAYLLTAFVIGLAVLGALALLNRLYPIAKAFPTMCLLAVSPACFLGLHGGQIDAVLLLALIGALLATKSGRFVLAGLLISLCLIKPNIFLAPLIMVWFLCRPHGGARRYAVGVACGLAISGVVWSVAGGLATSVHWLEGMALFSKHISAVLPSDPSLTTLYIGWAPRAFSVVVAFTLVGWMTGLVVLWRYCRSGDEQTWWFMMGMALWLIVTPHAHEYDGILIVPAIWWARQHLTSAASDRLVCMVFWVLWIVCPLTFLFRVNYHALPIQGTGPFPMLALIAALILVRVRGLRRPEQPAAHGQGRIARATWCLRDAPEGLGP